MLLCIDFQPAYAEALVDVLDPLKKRLKIAAIQGEEVHFIYNGICYHDGEELGDSPDRVLQWVREEELLLKEAFLLGKNFGWVSHLFRQGIERTIGVLILRHLMESGLSSSAEIPGSELERIVASSHDHFEGFWDCSPAAWEEITSGAIAMPFVFEGGMVPWLESLRGKDIEVVGGFRHRCLDEICMMLEAGGISYRLNDSIIYSLPPDASLCQDGMVPVPWIAPEDSAPYLGAEFEVPVC
jgi:hypothetical protein